MKFLKRKMLLFPIMGTFLVTGCNSGYNNVPMSANNKVSDDNTQITVKDAATDIVAQDIAYTKYISDNNITTKVDQNFSFRQLDSAKYKTMSVKYAEIDIPNSIIPGNKTQFFQNLVSRFLINKFGPEDFSVNSNKYTGEFMYYLNKPLPTTINDKKSQLRLGIFNEPNSIKIIIPINSAGNLPLSMIIGNYGIIPMNSANNPIFKEPSAAGVLNILNDGKNNPGLIWTGLKDGININNVNYILDQVEYSAGYSIANLFKGTVKLDSANLKSLNSMLNSDMLLLNQNYLAGQPSEFLNGIANVRSTKYEKEVIIPEMRNFLNAYLPGSVSEFEKFVSPATGTFIAGVGTLDYKDLHELEAEYIAYLYNDQTATTDYKTKAIHIHNLIQTMQMFGDANTRVARTVYYAYLFKHNYNSGFGFKDFAPIMGDSPLYKANLQMLASTSEQYVNRYILSTFLNPNYSKGFSDIKNFINQTVVNNIKSNI